MIDDNLNGHLSRNYTKQSVLLIDIIVSWLAALVGWFVRVYVQRLSIDFVLSFM